MRIKRFEYSKNHSAAVPFLNEGKLGHRIVNPNDSADLSRKHLLSMRSIPPRHKHISGRPIDQFSSKEVVKLVAHLAEREWLFTFRGLSLGKMMRKYGPEIINPEYLKRKIDAIEDPQLRKSAERNFIRYELKLAGHEFSIGGSIAPKGLAAKSFWEKIKRFFQKLFELSNPSKVRFEGWNQSITHAKLASSLLEHFETPQFSGMYSEKERVLLIESYKKSVFFSNDPLIRKVSSSELLEDWKAGKPVIIPTGWSGHSTEVVLYQDKLVYANRGEASDHFPRPGILIYTINHPEKMTVSLIRRIRKSYLPAKLNQTFLENPNSKSALIRTLGLEKFYFLAKSSQKVGNCTWVSAKGGFEGLSVLFELEKRGLMASSSTNSPLTAALVAQGRSNYKSWSLANRLLEFSFIGEYLQRKNADQSLFSPREEFFLWSEFFNKVYARLRKLSPDSASSREALKKLAAQFMSNKQFAMSDMMLDLAHLRKSHAYALSLIANKLPGAFLLYKTADQKTHILTIHSNGFQKRYELKLRRDPAGKEQYFLGERELRNFSDLQTAMKEIAGVRGLYPIIARKALNRFAKDEKSAKIRL